MSQERSSATYEPQAPLVERLREMLPPVDQEWAAVDYTIQEAVQALEDHHYADTEHEHLGCSVAKTGIYAQPSETKASTSVICEKTGVPCEATHLCHFPNCQDGTPSSASEPFLTNVCEELFGCHIYSLPANADAEHDHECAVCGKPINIRKWIVADHEPGCVIPMVREHLAKHRPASVPGYVRTDRGANNG